jgi:hypothetical protein
MTIKLFLTDLLPHNEHIISMTRIVSWVSYGLTAHLNIAALILWGNTLLLVLLAVLYSIFVPTECYPVPYFLLVVFVFLNPQYSVTALWAMALWSNIWVFVPVTFSILLVTRPTQWYWSLLFAIAATFANGNGLMIWPILILFFERRPFEQWVT